MTKRKPAWDMLSDKKRREVVDEIIAFFLDERGEKIGVVAAEQVLDQVLESAAFEIYNKGVKDAKKVLQEKLTDINIDIDLLIKDK